MANITESTRHTSTNRSSEEDATASPAQGFFAGLLRHLPSADKSGLPRKLATLPFAAALQTPPTAEQSERCRLQLERMQCISVRRPTRGQRSKTPVSLQLELRPEHEHEQVGIFVPRTFPVVQEKTRSVEEVRQLAKLIEFCVRLERGGHGHDCVFCSQLRAYLHERWNRLPLVTVAIDGSTVLRAKVLSRFLTDLVSFATTGRPIEEGESVEATYNIADEEESADPSPVCAAQDEIAVMLYDFFDV